VYEDFGAWVEGESVEFRLFFPDAAVDPTQYQPDRGGLPKIDEIRVVGDFQSAVGLTDWDVDSAPRLVRGAHANGWLWTHRVNGLPEGFYQYKYRVILDNKEVRWCGDPCTRFVVGRDENSGFVIKGPTTDVQPIAARLPSEQLVIYELMIDDFTAGYRGQRAPIDAIRDKIDHLVALGINAVQFMPWTGWEGGGFSWGYNPHAFFSVESRYVEDPVAANAADDATRLYRLKTLVNELHSRGIHVLMDGVFNHVEAGTKSDGKGFAYHWFYQDPADSPYTGGFAQEGYFEDLDYHNLCTQQFTYDVCRYWLDTYQLDGIRFDFTLGFYDPTDLSRGLPRLLSDLHQAMNQQGRTNVSLFIEHLLDNRYAPIAVANAVGATGCWYDRFNWDLPQAAVGSCEPALLRVLDTGRDFDSDKNPVICLGNHDHSTAITRVGGRDRWWKLQAPLIALYTCSGAVLVQNGQEFGQPAYLPDSGDGRVVPRPLEWGLLNDETGQKLFSLHARLAQIRAEHPALRSHEFYPRLYDQQMTHFNSEGYGIDSYDNVVIYHRWGSNGQGGVEKFIIVLNFGDVDRQVRIPFPGNGSWTDVLNGDVFDVHDFQLVDHRVNSNWGKVFWQ